MTNLYSLLGTNRRLILAAFDKLVNLKGLECELYYPTTEGTIFGLEDLVEYDPLLADKKTLLVFGLFQEAEIGMEGYDSFIESYILTKYEDKIPQQTHVKVNFCNRSFSFKVDRHLDALPGVCSQVLIKNILVAAT